MDIDPWQVRLMGGEIRIVDKDHGEKGTCFTFNIFLTCNADSSTETEEQGNYTYPGGTSTDVLHYFGLHRSPMPRSEGSHVILLLAGEERRKISRKVMENIGIKVSVAKRSKDILKILEMIKQKMDIFQCSSTELSPVHYLSTSSNSNLAPKEGSSSTNREGNDHIYSHRKSNSKRSAVNFILIVMDANAGPFTELCSIISIFKKETPNIRSKVVWLENPINSRGGEDRPRPPCDYILSKPFHGSRLYKVAGLLPEFGGGDQLKVRAAAALGANENNSDHETCQGSQKLQLREIIVHEKATSNDDEKPAPVLQGKSVLIVEDDKVLRKVNGSILSKLGAKVDTCENGKEAFDLICNLLRDQNGVHQKALPFDYIFMDCEVRTLVLYLLSQTKSSFFFFF